MNLKQTLETPNKIKYDIYLNELSEDTVRKISTDQKEPQRMLEHRLKSLEIYNNMPMPKWGPKLDEITPLIQGQESAPLNKGGRGDLKTNLPYNKKNIAKAKELRKNMTKAEKKLWYDYLNNLDIKVLRQRPIDNYIVDFYIASKKLVIEIDGDTHRNKEEIKYDKKRTKKLESYGLKVIRFTNTEVFETFDEVCKKIEKINPPSSPLKNGDLNIYNNQKLEDGGIKNKKGEEDSLVRYAKPASDNTEYATSWNEVPQEIKDKFDKLGIPEAEKKYLAGAGGQMDSVNFYHKIKEKRAKVGVIFEDMPTAIQKYEELIKKYFMKLVPPTDHKFAALHGAVRSGGTFIYIPKGVKADEPLQAYFRMNTYAGGQFEHTLIIVDDDAECSYIEGCSAPKYDKSSIHAGLVEIFVGKNSTMRYSSVENRSTNTYNLNTKRALIEDDAYMERISGNLGSQTTMLYPCSILKGDNSKTDLLGIVIAGKNQNQDVGSKAIHIGKNTTSNIVSKSISKDGGISTYRGLVSISRSAENSISNTQCDAILIDGDSSSITIPNIKDENGSSTIAHEASAGKIDEGKLFYLTSRGIKTDKATSMIINGFFSEITKKLPLEYAGELNTLIEMEMENSIG